METFEVKRGLAKKLASEGGLAGVASKHFDNIDGDGDAFTGNHGIMTSISGEYNALGKLVVDVSQVLPDFKDEDAMIAANDDRRRWSAFLDEATGYNSKPRGAPAQDVAKNAALAMSGITPARYFMDMATNLSDETRAQAEEFITTIEGLLEAGDNTKAESTAKKLGDLLSS